VAAGTGGNCRQWTESGRTRLPAGGESAAVGHPTAPQGTQSSPASTFRPKRRHLRRQRARCPGGAVMGIQGKYHGSPDRSSCPVKNVATYVPGTAGASRRGRRHVRRRTDADVRHAHYPLHPPRTAATTVSTGGRSASAGHEDNDDVTQSDPVKQFRHLRGRSRNRDRRSHADASDGSLRGVDRQSVHGLPRRSDRRRTDCCRQRVQREGGQGVAARRCTDRRQIGQSRPAAMACAARRSVGNWFDVGGELSRCGELKGRGQPAESRVPLPEQRIESIVEHGASDLQ